MRYSFQYPDDPKKSNEQKTANEPVPNPAAEPDPQKEPKKEPKKKPKKDRTDYGAYFADGIILIFAPFSETDGCATFLVAPFFSAIMLIRFLFVPPAILGMFLLDIIPEKIKILRFFVWVIFGYFMWVVDSTAGVYDY